MYLKQSRRYQQPQARKHHRGRLVLFAVFVTLASGILCRAYISGSKTEAQNTGRATVQKMAAENSAETPMSASSSTPAPKAQPVKPASICQQNAGAHAVFINITQQHMWACSGAQQVYDTAVTTGAYKIDGDATPTGTWHIFSKETNLYLTGPGYKDWVQYWMPFYSDYGFHDASWQTFPFGSSQYATDGSHGCVHLPTPAAAWLYNWAPIGTTVTIQA